MVTRRLNLFRGFGFPIRIDLSWIFIAVLVTWSLAVAWFPHEYTGLTPRTYWLMGIAGALGLFTSIVLHELGHAIVARRYGMKIRGITLFIFGGVAEMDDEPPSARAEFMVAIAGPLVSVWIGMMCFLISRAGEVAGWPEAVWGVFNYLAIINTIVVVFNLVPAFPLDGGRMLRSALWKRKANLRKATRISSRLGSGFGLFLFGMGLFSILAGNLVGGLWWIILGMFLRSAAQMSYQQLLVRRALEGEAVSFLMEANARTVPPKTSIARFVNDYVYKYHHKMFPVVKDGVLSGCVSTESVKEIPRSQWDEATIDDIVQPCNGDNTISPDEDAAEALSRMSRSGRSRLVVTDNGQLVGILSLRDMLKYLTFKLDLEEDAEFTRAPAI